MFFFLSEFYSRFWTTILSFRIHSFDNMIRYGDEITENEKNWFIFVFLFRLNESKITKRRFRFRSNFEWMIWWLWMIIPRNDDTHTRIHTRQHITCQTRATANVQHSCYKIAGNLFCLCYSNGQCGLLLSYHHPTNCYTRTRTIHQQ